MKEVKMTIPQFLAYERGEKTIKEINLENGIESLASKIISDKRLNKLVVFTIAGLNYTTKALADTTDAMGKINTGGFMILGIAQTLGYWLCLIGCIIEILKTILNGTNKEVGKIMMKYILFFGALYLMPFAFDMIKEIFE